MATSSKRQKDNNGFIEIRRNPISKSGIFPYSAQTFGRTDKQVINIYRPEVELSDEETINSLKLMPLIDEHQMLGDGATPAEKKGVHGVVGEDVAFDSGILYGNLKIYSNSLMDSVDKKGKRELSAGMRSTIDWTPGSINGIEYDGIQKNIRFNHVALVNKGRMGSDVRILDEAEMFEFMDSVDVEDEQYTEPVQHVEPPGHIELLQTAFNDLKEFIKQELRESRQMTTQTMDTQEPDPAPADKPSVQLMDAAEVAKMIDDSMAKFKAEFKAKNELHDKLKPLIGVFDHDDMTLDAMAKYATEKLSLNARPGFELATLDGYLAAKSTSVMDSGIINMPKTKPTLTLAQLSGAE